MEITTVFCDVGGVLLTNGWGHESRQLAAKRFHFDYEEFEQRHNPLAEQFDSGLITTIEYLNQALFYRPRSFNQAEFMAFMREQSLPLIDRLEVIADVAASKKYLMATINNESIDLNLYRIDKFELEKYFSLFFTSCFMRCSKPKPPIYDNALSITQKSAKECIFIDDREENLVVPKKLGMRTVQCFDAQQLRRALAELGVVTQRPPHLV
jgi:putative hydrolase of the HAD superfamily